MKQILIVVLFFICTQLEAQMAPIQSKVYSTKELNTKKKITSQPVLAGSGKILAAQQIRLLGIPANQVRNYAGGQATDEYFFIVKEGHLKVHFKGKDEVMGKGSIIFLALGDSLTISNADASDCSVYEMKYHSDKKNSDTVKVSEPSFIKNWNDMVFKPTEKGGTRQLFSIQTAMLHKFDIHVTTLNEGFNSHPPHTHTNEEIILMLDGNAEMTIGDTHPKANAGDVVWLESMIPHNLTNVGKSACLYFAIQWN